MPQRNIRIASVEYEQLGENLRATWGYISDLAKMWVTFEVLSIILVLTCSHYQQLTGEPSGITSKFFMGTIVFAFLAMALSFGAATQNYRLFKSASMFVKRAAYIEKQNYFDQATKNEIDRQYTYMETELYSGRLELANVLTLVYAVCILGWVFFISSKIFM